MASGAFASAGLVRQGRGRLLLEIDVRERLVAVIAHDESDTDVLDRPGRREAAGRHFSAWISIRRPATRVSLSKSMQRV